jgi:hypothetical protein
VKKCGESWVDAKLLELTAVGLKPGAREADRVSNLVPVTLIKRANGRLRRNFSSRPTVVLRSVDPEESFDPPSGCSVEEIIARIIDC